MMDTEKPITVTDALLALAEQYRSDMMFPSLSDHQRQRRIAEIDRVIARVEKPVAKRRKAGAR